MIIVWIIVSIILFSIIVLVHEWWHFSTARLFWVRVEEFWLWITPRARKIFTDKKWTLYSLNWLPIWWFVKLTWEMPNTFLVYNEKKELYNNEDLELDIEAWKNIYDSKNNKISEDDKKIILFKLKENKASYNLMNKPAWQQAIIILAWVFMNFLLASLIFSVLFFIWIKPIWINTKIETELDLKLIPTYEQAIESGLLIKNEWLILSPVKWSIAEKAWIIDWDIVKWILESDWWILKINETNVLIEIIWKSWNKKLNLIINRNWTEKNIEIIPILWENETWNKWKIWAYIWDNIILNTNFEYKYWITDSIKSWVYETYNQSLLTFKWLWILIKKIFNPETPKEREEALSEVSGPIWIVDFVSNSLSAWITFLFILWAVISINLWVFNLLPIPALDWWRFLFITINGLIKRIFWKKAISDKTEWIIHVWFFMLLIALSIIIAYNDINKIISQ